MKNTKYITGDVVTLDVIDGLWKVTCTPFYDDVYELERASDDIDDYIDVRENEIGELVEKAMKARLMYYKKRDEMVIEIYDREDGWCYCYGTKFTHSKEYDNIEEPEFIHIGLLHKIVELQKWGYTFNLDWKTRED